MTASQLKQFWQASPFVPFKILLPGAKSIRVSHPEFLTISPSGRIAHVWKSGDEFTAIDIFSITALEPYRVSSGRRKS